MCVLMICWCKAETNDALYVSALSEVLVIAEKMGAKETYVPRTSKDYPRAANTAKPTRRRTRTAATR